MAFKLPFITFILIFKNNSTANFETLSTYLIFVDSMVQAKQFQQN
jgi:hypothetical protein